MKVPGPRSTLFVIQSYKQFKYDNDSWVREAAATRLARTRGSSNQWYWLLALALTKTKPTRSNGTGERLSSGKTISWSTIRTRCQAQDTTTSSLPLQTSPSISSTTAKPDIVYTYSQNNSYWKLTAITIPFFSKLDLSFLVMQLLIAIF